MGGGASAPAKTVPDRVRFRTAGSFENVIDTPSIMPMDNASLPKLSSLKAIPKSDEIRELIKTALTGKFMFGSLNAVHMGKLIDVFSPVNCKAGDHIIKQGDTGDFMYIIESGRFDVTKEGQGKLNECGTGHTIGELALLYNAHRSATVTCVEDAKLWALDRSTFRCFQAYNAKRITQVVGDILRNVPLLKDLAKAQVSKAAEVATTVDFQEGDVIISKGEIGNTFFIILEGVVNCSEADLIDSETQQMGTKNSSHLVRASLPAGGVRLKAGDWFGEIALLTGSVRTANVVADSSVKLAAFDRKSFEQVLGNLKDIIDKKANNRMLSALPIIANLPPDRREAAVEMFNVETFDAGDLIAKCGDPNPRFLFLKSGRCAVWKHPNPKELIENSRQARMSSDVSVRRSRSMSKEGIIEENQTATTFGVSEASTSMTASNPTMTAMSIDSQNTEGANENDKSKEEAGLTTVSEREFSEQSDGTGMGILSSKRSLIESIEHSFDAFSTFEMRSASVYFAETELGKQEALWRRGVNVQLSSSGKGARESSDEPEAPHANELASGESVGGEAVINGTPMDCTVIAQSEVSLFVLSRNDLFVLLDEDMADDESTRSTITALSTASRLVSYIDNHETRDVDWAHLENLGKIGAGTFGTVYMMKDKNNIKYAMKVLDKARIKQMKQERRVKVEQHLLLSMKSNFISKCFGVNQDDQGYYLLLEMVSGGELKRLMHPTDRKKRNEQHEDACNGKIVGIPHQPAKFYIAAISIPLKYLHRRMVAFRDLKPENVMIDHFGYPKLIDFGLAKPLDDSGKTYTLCGTPEFLAPEVIMGHGHNQAVDWWALGVLLYEMIVGISPYIDRNVARNRQDQMTVFENIVDNRVIYPRGLEPACLDLIQRLLTVKPAYRMGCGRKAHTEFEEHEWFHGVVDWYALNKRQVTPPWIPPRDTRN